jgi:phosphate transport system permease protein
MHFSLRYYIEKLRKSWMIISLVIILSLPFLIGISLLFKSWPLLVSTPISEIILSSNWMPTKGNFGLWPFIFNSIVVSLLGLLIMIPFTLASAIYITQFAPNWISKVLRTVIDILAGIPSVIFGLWGIIVIVPMVSEWATSANSANASGYSILAAGIVVAVTTLPFVLNMLIELFESVPRELKESTLAMGASHWQTIKDVILKKIRPGIIAAFTLGLSKAFGETIAVLMVVGNVVQIPNSIFDAGYPLPALLANNYGEMMSIPKYDSALMLSALMLLIIVILFNYFAHKVIRFYQSKM